MWWLGIRSSAEFTALNGVDHPVSVAVEASKNPAFPAGDDAVVGLAAPKWRGLGNAAK
jgi:hypothetical protein